MTAATAKTAGLLADLEADGVLTVLDLDAGAPDYVGHVVEYGSASYGLLLGRALARPPARRRVVLVDDRRRDGWLIGRDIDGRRVLVDPLDVLIDWGPAVDGWTALAGERDGLELCTTCDGDRMVIRPGRIDPVPCVSCAAQGVR